MAKLMEKHQNGDDKEKGQNPEAQTVYRTKHARSL
jgi:hypothetical protein